jgi:pilus assembly protein Flp/PilA
MGRKAMGPAERRIARLPNGVVHTVRVRTARTIPSDLAADLREAKPEGPRRFIFLDQKGTFMLSRIARFARQFLQAEDGPTAVEYAVMLALIIVVCIGAVTTLGQNANTTFSSVGSAVGSASS